MSYNIGEKTASYVIYKEGNKYIAENGSTSKIDYSGTDASTVIQNAIDALSPLGGTIFIKNGVYVITSTIYINKLAVHIVGEGRGQGLYGTYDKGVIFRFGADLPDGLFKIYKSGDYISWVTIENLDIEGDNRAHTGIGINAFQTKLLQLNNLYIHNIDGYAIKYDSCHAPILQYSLIENCGNTTDEKPAIWISDTSDKTTTPTFLYNIFEPCYYGWIHQDMSATNKSRNGKIIGNYFEDDGNKGEYGIITSAYYKINSNNFIGDINHSFVEIYGDSNIITGNSFSEGGRSQDSDAAFIYVSTGSDRTIISNNVFAFADINVIIVKASYKGKITNNIIYNCDYHGINLANSNYWDVSENSFFGVGVKAGVSWGRAFFVDGNYNNIFNNIIWDADYGIGVGSGYSGNTIENNKFYSVTTPIEDSGTATVIKNNIGYTTENLGTAIFLGDGSTTSFTIAHGLTTTPTNVRVSAGSADAQDVYCDVHDATSTNIYAKFATAPSSPTTSDSGTAESGTSTTLTDTDKSWSTDTYAGYYVKITGGTGSGQIRKIKSNTSDTLTIYDTWDTNPSSDSQYNILDKAVVINWYAEV